MWGGQFAMLVLDLRALQHWVISPTARGASIRPTLRHIQLKRYPKRPMFGCLLLLRAAR